LRNIPNVPCHLIANRHMMSNIWLFGLREVDMEIDFEGDLVRVVQFNCRDGNCPAIYTKGADSFVVRGYRLDAGTLAKLQLPGHEDAVEIPVGLIDQLARYQADQG
jgi:hypothetical protein